VKKVSIRFVLCLFFLQYPLIAESRDQPLEKSKQSHPHSSKVHSLTKKNANSLGKSRPSEDCRKPNCKKSAEKISQKRPSLVLQHQGKKVLASWYGPGFHGKKTQCHETFNQHALTAASNTLPCGAKVHLFNAKGKHVIVRINDTGSFSRKYGRDIDVSRKAAQELDLIRPGHAHLEMTIVSLPSRKPKA